MLLLVEVWYTCLLPVHFCFIWLSWDFLLIFPETNQRICFLNGSPDEVIRSLFYNKNNDSLITVSVYGSENFSALRCRTTRIEYAFGSTCFFHAIMFFYHVISLKNYFQLFKVHSTWTTWCWFPSFWDWVLEMAWICGVWWCEWEGFDLLCSRQVHSVSDFRYVWDIKYFVNPLWSCLIHTQHLQGVWFEKLHIAVFSFW